MNRRQFLTGVSAAAVASALPATSGRPTAITWDLASGPDRTALWIAESYADGFTIRHIESMSLDGWDIANWRTIARCCDIVTAP